ncbi:cytochrome c oxidase subunit 3 [Kiloniella sp. b19]|uniref:cytochrome c oxidase subunit 3 n=1 Tax=Kiloniella sp. GXU_MW_B19 TaxID=3141326 RepID=UPI0031D6F9F7
MSAGHDEVKHPYHLVEPSIWPLLSAFAGGLFATGMVLFMHDVTPWILPLGVLSILICMFGWWREVVDEAYRQQLYNPVVRIGLRYGMILFIASEVMFFFAFFWAFFDASLFPKEAIGFVWPPEDIVTFNAFDLPFLNTLILLLSGCTVTWAHHAILHDDQKSAVQALTYTVVLGIAFSGLQAYEYSHAAFGFTDGIYASTFYMATGFHGFHVLVGTIFLFVCLQRAKKGHFTPDAHVGFEAAAWYWHFVDVVWLFLFFAVYWWGG